MLPFVLLWTLIVCGIPSHIRYSTHSSVTFEIYELRDNMQAAPETQSATIYLENSKAKIDWKMLLYQKLVLDYFEWNFQVG